MGGTRECKIGSYGAVECKRSIGTLAQPLFARHVRRQSQPSTAPAPLTRSRDDWKPVRDFCYDSSVRQGESIDVQVVHAVVYP